MDMPKVFRNGDKVIFQMGSNYRLARNYANDYYFVNEPMDILEVEVSVDALNRHPSKQVKGAMRRYRNIDVLETYEEMSAFKGVFEEEEATGPALFKTYRSFLVSSREEILLPQEILDYMKISLVLTEKTPDDYLGADSSPPFRIKLQNKRIFNDKDTVLTPDDFIPI